MIRSYDSDGKKVTRINLFKGTNIRDPFLTLGGPKLSCIKQYISLGGRIAHTCEKNKFVLKEANTVAEKLMSKFSCDIKIYNEEFSDFISAWYHDTNYGTIFLDLCTPINSKLFSIINYICARQKIPVNLGITIQRRREQLPKETMSIINNDRLGFLKHVISQYANHYQMNCKFLFSYEYIGVGHAAMAFINTRLEPTKLHKIPDNDPIAEMYNLKNILSK